MEHANDPSDLLRRKTPSWFLSLGIHAGLALVLGMFWIVQSLEEEKIVVIRPVELVPETVFPVDIDAREDKHAPIVPKEFQPDPVIVNDAFRVVENTIPENEQTPRAVGESPDRVTDRPFRSNRLTDAVGTAGGAGGAYGFPTRPAGFG